MLGLQVSGLWRLSLRRKSLTRSTINPLLVYDLEWGDMRQGGEFLRLGISSIRGHNLI